VRTIGISSNHREAGFTLFEVLVVAFIVGVLATVTFPNFASAVSAHRLTAGLRSTLGAIRTARSSAISRNVQARVTVSDDGKTLSVEANRPGVGWIVVSTPVALEGGVTVSSVAPANGLQFNGQGIVGSAVTVTVRNARGDTRQILVSLLGGVDIV